MTERVAAEVRRSNEVADQIEQLVVAKGQAPTGDRNTILMAYWSLAFEFHRAVLCLIEYRFYGAAFALVRPIIETTVRAHIAVMGSEDELRKLHSDEYRTNLATVGEEIDRAFTLNGLFQNFLVGARKALHSYTHAGMSQLGRRFKGNDLIPDYEEREIVEVIRVSTSAAFMVNNLVTKRFGFEEEWKKNTELYTNWGKG